MDPEDSTFVRGPILEAKIQGTCPYCGGPGLVMRSLSLEIPFFGDALQTTVLCPDCSFRHADLILTKEGTPVRYALRVETPSDLAARVVRSSAGTIRIPELGVLVEPGFRSEASVSNAEGVLHKVRDIVAFAGRSADGRAAQGKAEALLARIDAMIEGREPFTLILEDPTGNSAILHERARKRALSKKEARRLKRGVPEFRLDATSRASP